MTDVGIIGVGMTRFTKQWERNYDGMAREAIGKALNDAGLRAPEIQAIFCGSVAGGSGIGQFCTRDMGFNGPPIVNIENACASGSNALFEAYAWVKAGLVDVALAFGVEILSPAQKGPLKLPRTNWLLDAGLSLPSWYAMKARRRMAEHGLTREELAAVAVKSRKCATHNPNAHFQSETTIEEVLASPSISDPLTLFQCCPKTDGAAAVVVASDAFIARRGLGRIAIRGAAFESGRPIYSNQPLAEELPARAARHAFERAGIAPQDLDVVEVHDAFSIGEILYTEALGICPLGEGGRYVASGKSLPGGEGVCVNPSGGLLSRGHPLGASGLAMIHEVVTQLRGQAGARQAPDARLGATHTMGANEFELEGNACAVFVLEAV